MTTPAPAPEPPLDRTPAPSPARDALQGLAAE